jgi:(p)ppGpp synthase/HD superfamily hydrolase
MATLTQAIILAAKQHEGQTDKGGNPYLFHPMRMMLRAAQEEEQIVAILHDTIENTSLTKTTEKDRKRLEKYSKALDVLLGY